MDSVRPRKRARRFFRGLSVFCACALSTVQPLAAIDVGNDQALTLDKNGCARTAAIVAGGEPVPLDPSIQRALRSAFQAYLTGNDAYVQRRNTLIPNGTKVKINSQTVEVAFFESAYRQGSTEIRRYVVTRQNGLQSFMQQQFLREKRPHNRGTEQGLDDYVLTLTDMGVPVDLSYQPVPEADMYTLRRGQRIQHRGQGYEIVAWLGQGIEGQVYLVKDGHSFAAIKKYYPYKDATNNVADHIGVRRSNIPEMDLDSSQNTVKTVVTGFPVDLFDGKHDEFLQSLGLSDHHQDQVKEILAKWSMKSATYNFIIDFENGMIWLIDPY